MKHKNINTADAPAAIGTYSQAIIAGSTIYLSGQIPLVPETMELVSEDFREQAQQVFSNLAAVAAAAGATLEDAVKLNIYLTDMQNFPLVNEVMTDFFNEPYPARAAIGVAALPRNALVEVDAVLDTGN